MKKIVFALAVILGIGTSAYSQCSSTVSTSELCNGDIIFWFNVPFFSSWNVATIDSDFGDGVTQHDSLPHIDTVMTTHTYAANGSYTAVFTVEFYDTLGIVLPCSTNITYTFNVTSVIPPPSSCAATFIPTQYCMDSIHFEPNYGAVPCNYSVAQGPTITNFGDTLITSSFGLLPGYTPWPLDLTFNYSYMYMGSPVLQCSTTVAVPAAINSYQLNLFVDTSGMPTVLVHDTSSTNMYFTNINWGDGYLDNYVYQYSYSHQYVIDGTYTIQAGAIPSAMYNYFLNDSSSATCYSTDSITLDIHGASNGMSCNLSPVVHYDLPTQTLDFQLMHNGQEVTSPNLDVAWSFNNGMNSNLDFGTIDSVNPGPTSFTVDYTIYNSNGNQTCTASLTNSINNIYTPCNALLYIYEDSLTPGLFWADELSSGGLPPYTYLWDFGDGTYSNLQYPSHTYAVPAIYMICMTITDSQVPPCSSTYCDTADARAYDPMFQFNVNNPFGIGIEQNTQSAFNLFPNPAGDFIIVNAGENYSENLLISIYDLAGHVIQTRRYQNTGNIAIGVEDWSSGVYFLKIDDGERSMTRKFIKK